MAPVMKESPLRKTNVREDDFDQLLCRMNTPAKDDVRRGDILDHLLGQAHRSAQTTSSARRMRRKWMEGAGAIQRMAPACCI